MDLTAVLEQAGITPLRTNRQEVIARCPQHEVRTGKADVHPSWSINSVTYTHFCFSCGYRGTLTSLLIDMTGSAPEDLEKTLAKDSFLRKMAGVRADPETVLAPVIPLLTEWVLFNIMGDVPGKLLSFRHLQREAVDAYEVRWDADTHRWVLPLRSTAGDLLGAQYRQKGSVYTLPEGMEKKRTLFGFAQCCDRSFCAIVESPLDAVRLFGLGIPALSPLGAWVSNEQVRLLACTFTRVYMALDNDKAGRESAERLAPALRKAGTVPIPWSYEGLVDEDGDPAKDPGDVDDDDLLLASWSRTLRMGL
jgi:DNA primase